jgi:hypothetical protein
MRSDAQPLLPRSNLEQQKASKMALDLHDELIQTLIECVGLIELPHPASAMDSLTLTTEKNHFISAIHNSSTYERNVCQYIAYLATDFTTEADFNNLISNNNFSHGDEIGQLFLQPYRVMGRVYAERRFFGIRDYNILNFDSYLRLLFKIKFLQEAATKASITAQWFKTQYEMLARDVNELNLLVAEKNLPQIITKLNTQIRANVRSNSPEPDISYEFLEDDTLVYDDPFGYARPHDTLWLDLWSSLHEHPLQMSHAQLYPWSERVIYFLFGADVRKYFKDNLRWLYAGVELFYLSLYEMYHYPSATPVCSFTIGWMASNLNTMLFLDLPTAAVKGLLSLPFRLTRSITGIHLNGIPEKILTAVLYVARFPLAAVVYAVSIFLMFDVIVLSAITNVITITLIKPLVNWLDKIINPISTNKLQAASKQLFKLRAIIGNENEHACFLNNERISVSMLDDERTQLVQTKTITRKALLQQILSKETIELHFFQLAQNKHYYLVGNTLSDANFANSDKLKFDWNFYDNTPSAEQLNLIAKHLQHRQKPLHSFELLSGSDVAEKLYPILIANKHLAPQIINLGNLGRSSELKNLITLLKAKPSIQYITSLPESKDNLPAVCHADFEEIKTLLLQNRRIVPVVQLPAEHKAEALSIISYPALGANSIFNRPTPLTETLSSHPVPNQKTRRISL